MNSSSLKIIQLNKQTKKKTWSKFHTKQLNELPWFNSKTSQIYWTHYSHLFLDLPYSGKLIMIKIKIHYETSQQSNMVKFHILRKIKSLLSSDNFTLYFYLILILILLFR